MFIGIGLIAVPTVVFLYTRINARRNEASNDKETMECGENEIKKVGDRAPDFRYTL